MPNTRIVQISKLNGECMTSPGVAVILNDNNVVESGDTSGVASVKLW